MPTRRSIASKAESSWRRSSSCRSRSARLRARRLTTSAITGTCGRTRECRSGTAGSRLYLRPWKAPFLSSRVVAPRHQPGAQALWARVHSWLPWSPPHGQRLPEPHAVAVGQLDDGEPGSRHVHIAAGWIAVGDWGRAEFGERAVGDLIQALRARLEEIPAVLLDVVAGQHDQRFVSPGQGAETDLDVVGLEDGEVVSSRGPEGTGVERAFVRAHQGRGGDPPRRGGRRHRAAARAAGVRPRRGRTAHPTAAPPVPGAAARCPSCFSRFVAAGPAAEVGGDRPALGGLDPPDWTTWVPCRHAVPSLSHVPQVPCSRERARCEPRGIHLLGTSVHKGFKPYPYDW